MVVGLTSRCQSGLTANDHVVVFFGSKTDTAYRYQPNARRDFLLTLLVIVLLAIHLISTNLASAAPLMSIWLDRPTDSGDSSRGDLGRRLARMAVAALLLATLTGAGLILAPPSARLADVLRRFPAGAYWSAGSELVFSLVCLLVYAGCWNRWRRWRWLHAGVALLSVTNLLYHFPALMIVISKLATDPGWTTSAVIERSELIRLALCSEVLSLTLHYVLASIAVSGVAVLWMLARNGDLTTDPAATRRVARVAAGVGLFASLAQLPVGVWVLMSTTGPIRGALLGEALLPSLLLGVGILLTLLLLQKLAAVMLGEVEFEKLPRLGWLLFAIVFSMVAMLSLARADRSTDPAQVEMKTAGEKLAPRPFIAASSNGQALAKQWVPSTSSYRRVPRDPSLGVDMPKPLPEPGCVTRTNRPSAALSSPAAA